MLYEPGISLITLHLLIYAIKSQNNGVISIAFLSFHRFEESEMD